MNAELAQRIQSAIVEAKAALESIAHLDLDERWFDAELPTYWDGKAIDNLSDLATVLNLNMDEAAFYACARKDLDPKLVAEAIQWTDNPFPDSCAVMLIPAMQSDFAVKGGIETKDIHCTLAYFGAEDALKITDEMWEGFINSFMPQPQISASVDGFTVFRTKEDRLPAVVLVNSPQLEDMRDRKSVV